MEHRLCEVNQQGLDSKPASILVMTDINGGHVEVVKKASGPEIWVFSRSQSGTCALGLCEQ